MRIAKRKSMRDERKRQVAEKKKAAEEAKGFIDLARARLKIRRRKEDQKAHCDLEPCHPAAHKPVHYWIYIQQSGELVFPVLFSCAPRLGRQIY